MPPRTRQQGYVTAAHGLTGQLPHYYNEWATEHMTESNYPGSCGVVHYKYTPATFNAVDGSAYWRNFAPLTVPIPDIPVSLNWGKLPTSTEVGLIQLLAEIDETLLLFTKRFWKALSYGSFTWGVMPFVQDLIGTAKALRNLTTDLSKFKYHDEFTISPAIDTWVDSHHRVKGTLTCNYRYNGMGDLSFHHPGSLALDRLGFHPDLATAWDLVPLSFVVDYILPIGDYLQTFRQGGWVKSMYFQGWTTCEATFAGTMEGWIDSRTPIWGPTPCQWTAFLRFGGSDVLIVQDSSPDKWINTPEPKEAFNLFYTVILPRLASAAKDRNVKRLLRRL